MEGLSLTLPATPEGARALGAALSDLLDRLGAGGRARFRAELVAEEAFTNLVKHARPAAPVELSVATEGDGLRLAIVDDGPPFDPRALAPRAERDAAAQAAEGGFGIDLIRKSAARLDYETRADGRNVLTVWLAG